MPEELLRQAVALLQSGRAPEAEAVSRQLLAEFPEHMDVHVLRAGIFIQLGDAPKALSCLSRALELDPARADLHMSAAGLLQKQGDYAGAAKAYGTAAALKPGWFEALANQGIALARLGHFGHAQPLLQEALAVQPDSEPVLTTLAGVLHELGQPIEAEQAARKAVAAAPDRPEAWTHLGLALQDQGRLDDATNAYDQALRADPHYALALYNRSHVVNDQWRCSEALCGFREAIAMDPSLERGWHAYLMNLLYSNEISRQVIYDEHRRWGSRLSDAPGLIAHEPRSQQRSARRIRIGFMSPDFRQHSCAYFLQPLLAALDRSRFEIFAYAHVIKPDHVTAWFKRNTEGWREIGNMRDEEIARMVQNDGIDILVDLAGHTAHQPLGVFALKPAPVQVAWLGYPATSGLPQMDYRLTDVIADPPGDTDTFHSEALVRIPHSFFCYQPPPGAPSVSESPVLRNGHVTFGSFNNLCKVTPQTVTVWARILQLVPHSRLFLKARMLSHPEARANLGNTFAAAGIDAGRLDLFGWTPGVEESLSTYSGIDVALDTFPYNGTTTTLEALWMGVPVVTLSGDRHAGRVGTSILTNAGHAEWIAASVDEYIAIAAALGADRQNLSKLRASLRNDIAGSELCNATGFARRIETAFLDMLGSAQ